MELLDFQKVEVILKELNTILPKPEIHWKGESDSSDDDNNEMNDKGRNMKKIIVKPTTIQKGRKTDFKIRPRTNKLSKKDPY